MAAADHPTLLAATAAQLESVAGRTRPLALAEQRILPVAEPLAALLPEGGLRRGTTVGISGATGATSLALALAAGPSAEGSWVAAVGLPELGLAAAGELGVALERVAVVDRPPPAQWATVVAALLDAFDVVLVRPDHRVRAADARRLAARARERGAVLLSVGTPIEGTEVRLEVGCSRWFGVGEGHGHLQARQVEIAATGRRAAARPRTVQLWLLDPEGRLAVVERTRIVSAAAASTSSGGGRRVVVPFPGRGITASAVTSVATSRAP